MAKLLLYGDVKWPDGSTPMSCPNVQGHTQIRAHLSALKLIVLPMRGVVGLIIEAIFRLQNRHVVEIRTFLPRRATKPSRAALSLNFVTVAGAYQMLRPAICLTVFIAAAGVSYAAVAAGADRVRLQIGQENIATEILVEGSAGRYDRLKSTDVTLDLWLNAQLADSGFAILKSTIYLRAEGSGASARVVDTLVGATPTKLVDEKRPVTLPIGLNGSVAQNAVAACNALTQSERADGTRKLKMALPLVWRVTTGRFNFDWTNYDRVAPSADIINNRDFYAEQETADAELSFDATVVCGSTPSANAIASVPAAGIKQITFEPDHSEPLRAPAKTEGAKPSVVATSTDDKAKPQCVGGMLRPLASSGGSICLCPGNTVRVETGANAFACERARRR